MKTRRHHGTRQGTPAAAILPRSPMFDSIEIIRAPQSDCLPAAEPRNPMIIAGAIRESVLHGDVNRTLALLDELQASLTIEQFRNSIALVQR